MAKRETIATYDFDEDAMGLGDFITAQMSELGTDELVVYVNDDQSRSAKQARFIRETLTDGSTTVNLVIEFDRQFG